VRIINNGCKKTYPDVKLETLESRHEACKHQGRRRELLPDCGANVFRENWRRNVADNCAQGLLPLAKVKQLITTAEKIVLM
jgi:hypothetical protein